MIPVIILFPSDYFNKTKVDAEFSREYQAVLQTDGLIPVVFGYDSWLQNGKITLTPAPSEPVIAIYRGWMMSPGQYGDLEKALGEMGIHLMTSSRAYEFMHLFPNNAHLFGADTAAMKLYPLHTPIDIQEVKKRFDRFMVKDYVKSVKGTDFPRFFGPDTTQEYFDHCMELFYRYRGDLLTQGICIKEYRDLKQYDDCTNEYRVFYMLGRPISVCRNSHQPLFSVVLPDEMIDRYASFDIPFYTVDYAQLQNGAWIVIESGDGGVSGLSDGQDAVVFYETIARIFREQPDRDGLHEASSRMISILESKLMGTYCVNECCEMENVADDINIILSKAKQIYIGLWGRDWVRQHKKTIGTDWSQRPEGTIIHIVQNDHKDIEPLGANATAQQFRNALKALLAKGDRYWMEEEHCSTFFYDKEKASLRLIQHW